MCCMTYLMWFKGGLFKDCVVWISIIVTIQLFVEVFLEQIECMVQGLGDIGIKTTIRVFMLRSLSNCFVENLTPTQIFSRGRCLTPS